MVLLKRLKNFCEPSLIVILSVFCTRPSKHIMVQAIALLKKQLALCSNPNELTNAALYLRSPKRYFLPKSLAQMVDDTRRTLDPTWGGVWENGGLRGVVNFQSQTPKNTFDQESCLNAASQVSDALPWLRRYLSLGGSPKNPKYLRIRIAKAFSNRSGHVLDTEIKKCVNLYCQVESVHAVRKLLRSITPVSTYYVLTDASKRLARFALLVYCGCEKLDHNLEDLVHLGLSSLYLEHSMVQKIIQRALATSHRTPDAQKVFERLVSVNGDIHVTMSAKEDIAARVSNPIWQSVYKLLPVDANAKSILISYSRFEVEHV